MNDELTQILNRRGFDSALDKELDRLYRNKKDTSLILMIDLNNFKSINDTHGHSFGDQALKLVAKTIEHNIRTMDVAARLGGDEFGVLLTQAKTDKALDRVQDLARKLNSLTIRSGNKIIRLSASIGISPIKAGDTAENILNIADQRMYDDKRKRKKKTVKT
jgi:diguanylate cyclase (GGDEF)-like protein